LNGTALKMNKLNPVILFAVNGNQT
jgi:hypothetical protein